MALNNGVFVATSNPAKAQNFLVQIVSNNIMELKWFVFVL